MYKYFITLLLISGFPASRVMGQGGFLPGYIVTLQNDSIEGFVKNKYPVVTTLLLGTFDDIKFKKTVDGDVTKYDPTQLAGFQRGAERFVAMNFTSDGSKYRAFMKVLESGTVNYYELQIGQGNTTTYFGVLQRKGESDGFSVYGPKFKERAAEYFDDVPLIRDKILAKKYGSALDLVREYNMAKFEPTPSRGGKNPSSIVFYKRFGKVPKGLFLFVNDSSKYEVKENSYYTFKLPSDVKSRVCLQLDDIRECILVSSLPHYGFVTEYYELEANSNKKKVHIQEKSMNVAQYEISQLRK